MLRPTKWWIVLTLAGSLAGCQGVIADPSGSYDDGDRTRRPRPDDDPEAPDAVARPDVRRVRLLTAREYRNTVRDLLGVEVPDRLQYGDGSTGFDNAEGTQLDENLLNILLVTAEEAAQAYARGRLAADFPCATGGSLDASCAETLVTELGRRAHRRPLDEESRSQLVAFARHVRSEAENGAAAAELIVTRLLMSPRFLYRTEVGARAGDVAVLDPFERASLLSYALTATMPDERLLADAEAGRLDAETTRDHVRRLLDSDAGRAQLFELFKQWLRAGELDRMAKAPGEFGKLTTPELGAALRRELATFVERVVLEEEGTFEDLLTHRTAYVDRLTAPLYGLTSESDTPEAQRIPAERPGGVLSLASVLSVHASRVDVGRENPIMRGLLVRNQLFCDPIVLPSGIDLQQAVDAVGEPADWERLPTRDRLEHVMQQGESCQGCHATFMPFGYLWTHFDGLGQYRTHFNDYEVDSSVDAVVVDGQVRAYADATEFLPELAENARAAACFRQQLARFVSGAVDGELVQFAAGARSFRDLPIVELLEALLSNETLYTREVE